MIYKDISENIEKLREDLGKSIEKNGIDFDETLEIIHQLDEMINIYLGIQNRG